MSFSPSDASHLLGIYHQDTKIEKFWLDWVDITQPAIQACKVIMFPFSMTLVLLVRNCLVRELNISHFKYVQGLEFP